jgi:hypothetical protein
MIFTSCWERLPRLWCASVRCGFGWREFSSPRAQHRHAHLHEPGRFSLQQHSPPESYRVDPRPHAGLPRHQHLHRGGNRPRLHNGGLGRHRAGIDHDTADRFGYGVFPLTAYLGMLAAAGLAAARFPLSADLLAGALLLLLAINIRNAWDLLLAFARRIASQRSDT